MNNSSPITNHTLQITDHGLRITDYPRVSIIILNWNGWADTIECLESLYQITYPNYDVIVVDNGSEDESIEKIKEYCEGKIEVESKFFEYSSENKPIKIIEYTREEAEAGGGKEKEISDLPSNRKLILIKSEKNYGFAEGNNIGMRYALKALDPDYVLLLNNDTVVDKEFLGELVKVAEEEEKIGIAGPKIYYYDYKGRSDVINFTGANLNLRKLKENRYGCGEIDKGQLDKRMEIDKIEGSAMLLKRKVLEEAGLFDPDYFTYWEETDLCFRAARKGFKSLYAQRAKIWHKEAASTGGTLSSHYIYYITRNQFLFLKKNATKLQLLSFLLYFFGFRFWFSGGVHLIYHRNINTFISFLRGVRDGVKMFH
ncbi:hypothetical protein ES705_07306 [subsurface metagenome]